MFFFCYWDVGWWGIPLVSEARVQKVSHNSDCRLLTPWQSSTHWGLSSFLCRFHNEAFFKIGRSGALFDRTIFSPLKSSLSSSKHWSTLERHVMRASLEHGKDPRSAEGWNLDWAGTGPVPGLPSLPQPPIFTKSFPEFPKRKKGHLLHTA